MSTTHADPTTGIEPATVDKAAGKIICNACPVLCNISAGRSGACDRYANVDGALTRLATFRRSPPTSSKTRSRLHRVVPRVVASQR